MSHQAVIVTVDDLRQQILNKGSEAFVNRYLGHHGIPGLLKPLMKKRKIFLILQQRGLEKTLFNPIGIDQEYFFNPQGGGLGQYLLEHYRPGQRQDKINRQPGRWLTIQIELQNQPLAGDLFLFADNGTAGNQLYRTDGTSAGTTAYWTPPANSWVAHVMRTPGRLTLLAGS